MNRVRFATKYKKIQGSNINKLSYDLVQAETVRLNTSLAAPGALAHRLQRLPVGPKMADGVWKGVYP